MQAVKQLGAGRRAGESDAKERILEAGERAFAARGFDGASLREIAEEAGVNQGLVRYYFGSKSDLFTAACMHRGRELGEERIRRLDELERRPGAPPTIEEIVRAYLVPAIEIKREGPRGEAFWQLQARLLFEANPSAREIRKACYEESTQRYIAALQRALPGIDATALYWRVVFMIGAYSFILTDTSRLDTTSGGRFSSRDVDESLRQLVSFIVGGMQAPIVPA